MRMALPKGRLWDSVIELLEKSGIKLNYQYRDYKPSSNIKELELFVIKPRNIPKLVEQGLVDIGIVGKDLVEDEKVDVDQVLDLQTMPVFIVLAGKNKIKKSKLIVATEYREIAERYFRISKRT